MPLTDLTFRQTYDSDVCSDLVAEFYSPVLAESVAYDRKGYFWPVKPPTRQDLDVITHTIAKRVSRHLERAWTGTKPN